MYKLQMKEIAIEVDAMWESGEDKEEDNSKESASEEHEVLIFMEPDHKEVRANEDLDGQK